MADQKTILFVLTNHGKINDDHQTGLWLEEFAIPYLVFQKEGYDIQVTSVQGGEVPLDPNSTKEIKQEWQEAKEKLSSTKKLGKQDGEQAEAIFLPGGHGTMFDLPDNETLLAILQQFAENGKIIAAVCHGPAGLVNATYENGTSLVSGKTLTAFTDEEEVEVQLDKAMPFLLETKLREKGADFVRSDKWADFSVRDGNLITGQNPQSSESTAVKVVEALNSLT